MSPKISRNSTEWKERVEWNWTDVFLECRWCCLSVLADSDDDVGPLAGRLGAALNSGVLSPSFFSHVTLFKSTSPSFLLGISFSVLLLELGHELDERQRSSSRSAAARILGLDTRLAAHPPFSHRRNVILSPNGRRHTRLACPSQQRADRLSQPSQRCRLL